MARVEKDDFRALHYLPGELLVTVRRGRDSRDVHNELRDLLNRELSSSGVELYDREPREGERRSRAMRFTSKRSAVEVHTFSFDDGGYPEDFTGESRVPEVIARLDGQLRRRRGRIGDMGTVEAVSPNWLAAPSQGWGTGGGPGLPPEPVPGDAPLPDTGFVFDPERLAWGRRPGSKQRVVVAVLDTSPTLREAQAAVGRYPANAFLKRVVETTEFHEGPLPDGVLPEFAHLVPFWANRTDHWQPTSDPTNRETYYNIVDHGLFVAGVVRSIAPEAEIHLYRVLDRVGVGNLAALLTALEEVGQTFLDGKTRLIVNLSLLLEEVPNDCPFKQTAEWQLYYPLYAAIDALRERGVLIVAAAGNDSLDLTTGKALAVRHGPRLPARLDEVVSVAALDQHGDPATFSNRSDSNTSLPGAVRNGIAIFGGNAAVDAATSEPEIADLDGAGPQPPIGIVGVYSREELPCDKGPNETGLVYWAGTSFATPVISGLAALRCAWAGAPSTPEDLIAEFVAPFDAELQGKALTAVQV